MQASQSNASDLEALLKPYQRDGVEYLVSKRRGLLWFEAGLGKSLTTLAALERMGARRVLVIAPASVLGVWEDESKKWLADPTKQFVAVRGTPAKRAAVYDIVKKNTTNRIVISYETARGDVLKLRTIQWDAIVLDETLKIQTPTSKTTKAIMLLTAPIRIALNGTPISNAWSDIWATFTWLEPTSLYGNWYAFRSVHAVMNPHVQGMIVGWRDTERIKKKVEPYYIRRTKAECLPELPPMTETPIRFPLSSKEQSVYNGIKKELLLKLPDKMDEPIGNVLTEMMRLRQVCNGLHVFGETSERGSKIDALIEWITPVIQSGLKVIIFTSFSTTADKVRDELNKAFKHSPSSPYALKITGATDTAIRSDLVREFKDYPNCQMLVGTDAMATGLNLQAASYVINLDLPWSYAKYEQRIARAWRLGQTNPVTVWNFLAQGTVDEKVAEVLGRKMETADEFAGVTREDIWAVLKQ
jgi:SNF2 family DNA or RNA helicase